MSKTLTLGDGLNGVLQHTKHYIDNTAANIDTAKFATKAEVEALTPQVSDNTTKIAQLLTVVTQSEPIFSLSSNAVFLDDEHPTAEVRVISNSTGSVEATVSDNDICMVGVSGKVITVSKRANAPLGKITVNVRILADANHAGSGVRTLTVRTCYIYGFKIDKNNSDPETRIEYTDDAVGMTPARVNLTTGAFDYGDWEHAFFMEGNVPVMLNYDGTEAYELDPNNYRLKKNGELSDVADVNFNGNAMARFPLVWFKRWEDDNYEYVRISDAQVDSSYYAYAHQRADGSIMDCIYLSIFGGTYTGGKMRSLWGLDATYSNSWAGFRSQALADNPEGMEIWDLRSWSQRMLVNDLLTLISRSDDSQSAFGKGYSGSSTTEYDKKRTLTEGRFFGTNGNDSIKVFHVYNWWGGLYECITGLVAVSRHYKVKMTPPYNADADGYHDLGEFTRYSGCISQSMRNQYGRFPTATGGSDTTYQCDYFSSSEGSCNPFTVSVTNKSGMASGAWALCCAENAIAGQGYSIGALSCEQPRGV